MSLADWLSLFTHFLLISLMAVGGAVTTAPEMNRYLVDQQHWLSNAQFSSSIAIAQAAPGPNILFVAVLGWNIGINTGGVAAALLGVFLTMTGLLLPSTILTYLAASWGHKNRGLRAVRAFKQGMAPIVISLLCATGWILASTQNDSAKDWPLWLLTAIVSVIIWRTKIHVLWMLAAGGILGWFGLV
jgi:chromate transporter